MNRLEDVFQREVEIRHHPVAGENAEQEIPGRNYFDGDTVYQARTRLQHWRNPLTRTEYFRNLAITLNTAGQQAPAAQARTVR
jgi:hypothetical protein